ncbi:MAG: RNA helicase [Candidatus Cloacimonadota bacterium]|nr:MAG: RNA helicase [Candidatus Cloacimonadota bacterium]PIE78223.1 MAG: RNA helicase [Candidatus Delongbacteria bacterium]
MKTLEKFESLGISRETVKNLIKKGFEEPTSIQEEIIPLILNERRDLVGQAQTGTGKTAAFGIPIVETIKEKAKRTQALILAPTRELAVQVSEEISSFKGSKKISIAPIYGGQSIEQQLKKLKRGIDVIVGTPGRILDHISRKSIDLSKIEFLILDEADEMLNMGFLDDVDEIIRNSNPERTTLLFSATMPTEIRAIAEKYMKNYELIKATKQEINLDLTEQIYFEVAHRDKFEALTRIIDIEDEFYGMVFCRTKVDVGEISNRLIDRGYFAEGLHGDISQSQRESILSKMKRKKINILVATDVAARGIDIQNLTHVINYTIPQDPSSYVHRIGRTGRAGKEGTAITFITPEEYRKLIYIQRVAKTDIRKKKVPKVDQIIESKKNKIKSDIVENLNREINKDYLSIAKEILSEVENPENVVASILQMFHRNELDPTNYNEIRDTFPQIKGKTRLFVAKGKKDNMSKRDLVEFIKKKTDIEDRKIEDVRVYESFSFITVPFMEAELIISIFKKGNRGRRPMVEKAKESKGGKTKRRVSKS